MVHTNQQCRIDCCIGCKFIPAPVWRTRRCAACSSVLMGCAHACGAAFCHARCDLMDTYIGEMHPALTC